MTRFPDAAETGNAYHSIDGISLVLTRWREGEKEEHADIFRSIY